MPEPERIAEVKLTDLIAIKSSGTTWQEGFVCIMCWLKRQHGMHTWQLIYAHLLHPFLFCFAFRIPAVDDATVVVPSMANDVPNLELYHTRAGTPGLPARVVLSLMHCKGILS